MFLFLPFYFLVKKEKFTPHISLAICFLFPKELFPTSEVYQIISANMFAFILVGNDMTSFFL